MIKRILVPLSQSPSGSSEVGFALNLARQLGAGITGFTAIDREMIERATPTSVGVFSYQISLREANLRAAEEEAGQAIVNLERACRNEGIEFTAASFSGMWGATLADVWRFQDLCVMSTTPWGPGEDGSTDASSVLHLVAMGLRPLIVVPDQASVELPEKVMFALSGSLDSAKALKHFLQMDIFGKMAAHVVVSGEPKSGESSNTLLDEASSYLELHGFSTTAEALPESSDRTTLLLNEAQRVGAGLLVMGSSYKKILTMKRFGKHALGLLKESSIPIFISH